MVKDWLLVHLMGSCKLRVGPSFLFCFIVYYFDCIHIILNTHIASLHSEVWGEPPSSSSKAEEQSKQHDDLNSIVLLPTTDINYEKLNTSTLQYQQNDDLMMHPNSSSILSMATSNDGTLLGTTDSNGTICVWKISDGKLLRKIDRAHGGVGGSDKGKLLWYTGVWQ